MTQTKNSLPLQTERLRLRELEASDFDAVHAYTSDPLGGAVTLALKGAEWLDWLSY